MDYTASFGGVAPSLGIEWDIQFSDDEARHVASSAFKRASRRMDWKSDDERTDARAGLLEQLGHEPSKAKWFPLRITEPTHLPV